MGKMLKVAEAAGILDVHPLTVRRLDNRGELKAQRDYLNHRVFKLTDILEYKAQKEKLTAQKADH